MAAGWSPEFSSPALSQEPGGAARAGPGALLGARLALPGQSRARNPNVLGQHRGKTGVEFKTLLLKNKTTAEGVPREGLGHSAKNRNGSCDWAEASREGAGGPEQGPGQGPRLP